MTHLLIASFDQQDQATEASSKLQELEQIGDITIYEMAVITKNTDGQASIVETVTPEGGQTVTGMAIGTVIGALAGPVGMVAGMLLGTLTGEIAELDDYGLEDAFVTRITGQLKPGATVLVLEVEEDDPVFIDSTLTMLGTEPQRTDVNYEYTKYSDEELEEFEEDILAARDKLKASVKEEKEKFRKKIAKLKARRKERIEELKEEVSERQASGKEKKVARIRGKIEKYQKKIAELEQKLAKSLQGDKLEEPQQIQE